MVEKEFYQYLNQVKMDCERAAGIDPALKPSPEQMQWSQLFFEKAASPYHYWKESQLLANGQPAPKQKPTDRQLETIHSFIEKHEELNDELKTSIDDLSKDEASKLIGDWMKRFIKK